LRQRRFGLRTTKKNTGNPENKETIHTFKQAIFSKGLILKSSLEITEIPSTAGNRDLPESSPCFLDRLYKKISACAQLSEELHVAALSAA
jgi:hypothetical protein